MNSGTFSVYYGPPTSRALDTLKRFRLVVVQTTLYTPEQLADLRAGGCRVLGYLSIGEDHPLGTWTCLPGDAPYHLPHLTEWGGVAVNASHPTWQATVLRRASEALNGADGLLLDTLDHADEQATLQLIRLIRHAHPTAFLLANRGFSFLPDLRGVVNAVLFEAFTTTHVPTYALHDLGGLAYTSQWAAELQALGLPALALDYADTPELARFAGERARQHGLDVFITDRNLSLAGGFAVHPY